MTTTTAAISYATRLRFNVKGGCVQGVGLTPDGIPLGPDVLIVGENESGKTSVHDAFRLAWLGKHPVGPHGTNLRELAPAGADTLFAELTASDWSSRFVLSLKGGRAEKPKPPARTGTALQLTEEEIENALPFTAYRELLSVGSTLGREALIRRFGKVTSVPLPAGLSVPQKAAWQAAEAAVRADATGNLDASGTAGSASDPAAVLSEMSAHFRREKGRLSKQAKAKEAAIVVRRKALTDTGAGLEELDVLEAQLRQAETWEASAALRTATEEIATEVLQYTTAVQPLLEQRKPEVLAVVQEHEAAEGQEHQQQIAAAEAECKRLRAAAEAAADQRKQQACGAAAAQGKARLEEARAAVHSAQTVLQDRKRLLANGVFLLQAIATAETAAEAHEAHRCPLCGGPWQPQELKTFVETRVQLRQKEVDEAQQRLVEASQTEARCTAEIDQIVRVAGEEAARATTEELAAAAAADVTLHNARQAYRTVLAARTEVAAAADRQVQALRQERARIEARAAENRRALEAVGAPATYAGPPAAELRGRVAALREAKHARDALDADAAELDRVQLEHGLAVSLEDLAETTLRGVLSRTIETAQAAFARYAPPGFQPVVDLDRAAFQMIGRDGVARGRHVMTGANFCALLPAVMLGWSEGAPARFVLADDVDTWGLSRRNFLGLLKTLREAREHGLVTQSIVCTHRTLADLSSDPEFARWLVLCTDGLELVVSRPPSIPVPTPVPNTVLPPPPPAPPSSPFLPPPPSSPAA